jgi:regulatory protein
MKRPPPSLHSRAMAWLAQREHSRSELRRKLLRLARAQPEGADLPPDEAAARVDELLAALECHGLLSNERFVSSRVRARSAGRGVRMIEQELAHHGVQADPATLQQLRDSEEQRARQLWQRRFGAAATEPAEHLRQVRFLVGRGFGVEVVRRVVAGRPARRGDGGGPAG